MDTDLVKHRDDLEIMDLEDDYDDEVAALLGQLDQRLQRGLTPHSIVAYGSPLSADDRMDQELFLDIIQTRPSNGGRVVNRQLQQELGKRSFDADGDDDNQLCFMSALHTESRRKVKSQRK